MTETSATEVEVEELEPETVYCRHCGQPHTVDPAASPDPQGPVATADWLCRACERYQDAMICPTCGGLARISLLPEGTAPEPHAPSRRRRAKE